MVESEITFQFSGADQSVKYRLEKKFEIFDMLDEVKRVLSGKPEVTQIKDKEAEILFALQTESDEPIEDLFARLDLGPEYSIEHIPEGKSHFVYVLNKIITNYQGEEKIKIGRFSRKNPGHGSDDEDTGQITTINPDEL